MLLIIGGVGLLAVCGLGFPRKVEILTTQVSHSVSTKTLCQGVQKRRGPAVADGWEAIVDRPHVVFCVRKGRAKVVLVGEAQLKVGPLPVNTPNPHAAPADD